MSLCGLEISCEPVKDSMEVCEHLIHINLPCELCKLQKQITTLTNMYKDFKLHVAGFHDHKVRQIDENRKISRRVDEIDHWKKGIMGNIRFAADKPYKCPICGGDGKFYSALCHACEGKGIVWG